mmetsp:Transcript_11998/g.13126  ORF Transcript_11998/g.13126 Transcript_11998/m.13126 type:complete len:100 (-) Transcript_11998:214-513(-)
MTISSSNSNSETVRVESPILSFLFTTNDKQRNDRIGPTSKRGKQQWVEHPQSSPKSQGDPYPNKISTSVSRVELPCRDRTSQVTGWIDEKNAPIVTKSS